jgi:hypothetical protein
MDDDKKFWMNMQVPSRKDLNIINKIKLKLKILETLVAIVSLTSLILTQFEYEIEYFNAKYLCNYECKDKKDLDLAKCKESALCTYKGQPVRVLVSILCALLAVLTVKVSHLSYNLKYEQRKIINSKIKLNQ